MLEADPSKITLSAGKYILAVSGGVDSMVLLEILRRGEDIELVVAHYDHGIRKDSGEDEQLVRKTAKDRGLEYISEQGKLGEDASEDKARQARYNFLNRTSRQFKADGIVTAHHQDDLLETAALNLIRGTNRRGITAIIDNHKIMRPMLGVSKQSILEYASSNGIHWNEDPTNKAGKYARNRLRRSMSSNMDRAHRDKVVKVVENVAKINNKIDIEIAKMSQQINIGNNINRSKFIMLPSEICNELMTYWLRTNGVAQYDKPTIDRLVLAIKTSKPGSRHSVRNRLDLTLSLDSAHFVVSP